MRDAETVEVLRKREAGVALLVSMMLLVLLSVLGISALEMVMRDQQVAGFQSRKRIAFQAAEAGVAATLATLSPSTAPVLANTQLGDPVLYPLGQPSYGPDPTVANPIDDLGATAAPGMNLRIGAGGPKFQLQYWKIRVEGREASGMTSRIETATAVFKGN